MHIDPPVRFAAAHGVDGVELDVQCTADGVLVAFHDWFLDGITNCTGFVYESSFASLAERGCNAAHAYCRQRPPHVPAALFERVCAQHHALPALASVVDAALARGLLLVLELKPGIRAAPVPAALHALFAARPQLYERAVVLSFYPWLLHAVRAADPRIPAGLLVRDRLLGAACAEGGAWARSYACRMPLVARAVDGALRVAAAALVRHLGLGLVAPHVSALSSSHVAQWRAASTGRLWLYAWGVNGNLSADMLETLRTLRVSVPLDSLPAVEKEGMANEL
jgi:glycerophosphoryl diester phosphodiesterase